MNFEDIMGDLARSHPKSPEEYGLGVMATAQSDLLGAVANAKGVYQNAEARIKDMTETQRAFISYLKEKSEAMEACLTQDFFNKVRNLNEALFKSDSVFSRTQRRRITRLVDIEMSKLGDHIQQQLADFDKQSDDEGAQE